MSVFDKVKDFYTMKKQANELQAALAKETATGSSARNVVRIILDGNQNVISVEIDETAIGDKALLERSVREALTSALNALKKMMVSKFSHYLK